MTDLLDVYKALSGSSTAPELTRVLQSIIIAPAFKVDQSSREKLLRLLLADIKSRGSDSRIKEASASQALLAVKMLGRHPIGSDYLSTEEGLSTLLEIAASLNEDNLEASCEALKCVANALLLHQDGRETIVSERVKGGEIALKMLIKASTSEEIFLLSRILFFATVGKSQFIIWTVEEQHEGRSIADILGAKVDLILERYLKNPKTPMVQDAMADVLKFTFNLLLHYPKMVDCEPQSASLPPSDSLVRIMGDYWSPKLDGLLSPILNLYLSIPPTNISPTPLQAPLTSAIHGLIAIPVNDSLSNVWLRKSSNLNVDVVQHTETLITRVLEFYIPKSESPDSESVREKARTHHPDPTSSIASLLESDTSPLDENITPLIILATRLSLGSPDARERFLSWLVPDDIDRDPKNPLDERPDTLGRCLRLMGSVYHPGLKEAVGEMLWAMCGQDAGVLCAKVGYGHVAGFLFEKQVTSVPGMGEEAGAKAEAEGEKESRIRELSEEEQQEGMTFASPRQVNPITGTYMPEKREDPAADMTEEEKEAEMEKLFVLFDRMEKTGALKPEQNPVRKAIEKSMRQ